MVIERGRYHLSKLIHPVFQCSALVPIEERAGTGRTSQQVNPRKTVAPYPLERRNDHKSQM